MEDLFRFLDAYFIHTKMAPTDADLATATYSSQSHNGINIEVLIHN